MTGLLSGDGVANMLRNTSNAMQWGVAGVLTADGDDEHIARARYTLLLILGALSIITCSALAVLTALSPSSLRYSTGQIVLIIAVRRVG
jgi:hypothetical protein